MNVDGTAEQKKTYYAVFIGNRYSVDYPYNEAIFEAKNVEAAKHKAVEYIHVWKLHDDIAKERKIMRYTCKKDTYAFVVTRVKMKDEETIY